MADLDDSFAKLIGRQPSDAECRQIYKIRDALGLQNNDALWLVLLALQHYQYQYEQFPQLISRSAKDTLAEFRIVADATLKASAEATKADLAKAVARAAQEVAHHVAGKEKMQWIVGCLLVTCICFGTFGWYMHKTGYKSGVTSGYGEAMDEKAAMSWANTPEGKIAFQFAQTSNFRELSSCARPGWKIKGGYCLPLTDSNNLIYGWQMPKN